MEYHVIYVFVLFQLLFLNMSLFQFVGLRRREKRERREKGRKRELDLESGFVSNSGLN